MKPIIILLSALLSISAMAQPSFEITQNLPLCYEQMKSSMTYPLAWQNSRKSFGKWRTDARRALLACAASFPPDMAFCVDTIAEEQRTGYKVLKIRFNVSAWQRINAYLLVPDGNGKHPAMLMLHDHGANFFIGKEKMVRPFNVPANVTEAATQWVKKCYDGVFLADYYAAQGYVVLVTDALMWGERGEQGGTQYQTQQALAANLMQMGYSLGGLMLHDDMRCTDFLASLPCVNAQQIGALGYSMGAYRAWMLAAATDKIKAAAAICWMNTNEHLIVPQQNQMKGGSAYAMLLPGLAQYMDYPHAASIACPKPMLFFGGSNDKLMPTEGVEQAYAIMHHTWQQQRADDKLITKLWNEKHFFNSSMQKEVLQFFNGSFEF